MASVWKQQLGRLWVLDAAPSPASSLVSNGRHFPVPNHVIVSGGLLDYVTLPAQFSASDLPPPSSLSPSVSLCLLLPPSLLDFNAMRLGCLAAIPLFE